MGSHEQKKGPNRMHPLAKGGGGGSWIWKMTLGDKIQKLKGGLLSGRGQILRGQVHFSVCTLLLTCCTGLCGAPCGWLADLMEN